MKNMKEKNNNEEGKNVAAYDREVARCNKVVALCHTIEIAVISIAYFVEFIKGARTISYVLLTILIGIFAPVLEWIFYSKKKDATAVKHCAGYGFAVFYIFIMFTTNNLFAFVYAIPMIIAISVYNDFKYSIPVNVGVVIVNCIQAAWFFKLGLYTVDSLAGLEIQVLVMVIIACYSIYTSRALEINKKEKVLQIEEQGSKTENLLNKTMNISEQISARIDTISSKISDLDEAVNATREAMQDVTEGSGDTAEAVQKQLEMTENIQKRVNDVKNGADQIISNVSSAKDAVFAGNENLNTLMQQVNHSVESGKTVTAQLSDLKAIMANMNSVVDIITNITSQTSLLALNASIEAARAGEAGKGFAVVASEISKMANETQDATVKITDMIGSVSEAINKVVDVTTQMVNDIDGQHDSAAKTEESFKNIERNSADIEDNSRYLSEIIEHLSSANSKIIDSISTISAISEEVSAHANNTYSISEKNSQVVGEVVAISTELKNLTAQLNA